MRRNMAKYLQDSSGLGRAEKVDKRLEDKDDKKQGRQKGKRQDMCSYFLAFARATWKK